jgi:MFS family permease
VTTRAARPPLRDFWHDLPREGKLLLSVVAFQFIGTGLVLPFWVVYLHEIRDFSLDTTGLLLALLPAAGFVIVAPGGALIDRIGPRKTMLASLVMSCAGEAVMAFADSVPLAVLGLTLVGGSFGLAWPSAQSMVASVVPSDIRQRYFGMNFALLNLGIGIGGVVGGLVADVDHPVTFQVMYLVEAVSYLPAMALLLGPLRHAGGPSHRESHEDDRPAVGYLEVVKRPGVAAITVLSFASAFVGYAQLNTGMPAYARAISEVSTRGLGWAFAANTLVIVLLQLVVLQRIEGRRRTRVVVLMSLLWGVSWLLLSATSLVPGTVGATLLVAACASVFALGETLLQPTIPAMVNDMAPDHLRGRYNAVSSAGFQAASVTGPPVAGFLIGHGLGDVYIGLLLGGAVLVAVISVRLVEPRLTPLANGLRPASVTPDAPHGSVAAPPPAPPVLADDART